jgi:broad specificity phosphatase PhoE
MVSWDSVPAVRFPTVHHDDEEEEERPASKPLILRLHLVRHGETVANRNKVAAGQSESPLTDLGIRQATLLGTAIEQISIDRFIVSDMERARHTARVISPSGTFEVEPRLREMAKGAREGLPKAMTYEEALKVRRESGAVGPGDIPRLEGDKDVWNRVSDWLKDAMLEAQAKPRYPTDDSSNIIYSVLVVTHAGIVRTICSRLVPGQLPASIDTSEMGSNGSTKLHLVVPNTSVTVLDLSLRDNNFQLKDLPHSTSIGDVLQSKLKLLTWCEHIHST